MADDTKVTARAWITFAVVSVLWGVPYFFIKIAVGEVSPAFVAWVRIALAALVLVPVAWQTGAFRGMRGRAAAVAGYAATEIAVPFGGGFHEDVGIDLDRHAERQTNVHAR